MSREKKYLPVNWIDGMRISKTHLMQLENSIAEQVQDAIGVHINGLSYGLLPNGIAGQSLTLQLYFDRSEYVTLALSECQAITPGGARIDLSKENASILATYLKVEHRIEELKHPEYEVCLGIDPYSRVEIGQPYAAEVRRPFTLPKYRIELLPYPQTSQPEYSAFQLTIGRIRVENGVVKLSEHYIAPSVSLQSHPRLQAAHQKMLRQLGEMEVAVTEVMQRIRSKNASFPVDASLLLVADKITDFLANSVDVMRLQLLYQPPIQLITLFVRFARTINSSLNSLARKQREDLLNYLHKWYELAPREMENLLRTMLTLSFDHNDIYASLNKVEYFVNRLTELLKKLGDIGHGGDDLPREEIYGWLMVYTDNRKRNIFKMRNRNTIIGRVDGNQGDVDFNISDDTWISRRHAKLSVREEDGEMMVYINDMGSNNGTYIHETKTRLKPNQEFILADGDTFQIGKTNIVFKSFASADSEQSLITQVSSTAPYEVADIKNVVIG